jgi:hypothetical protein
MIMKKHLLTAAILLSLCPWESSAVLSPLKQRPGTEDAMSDFQKSPIRGRTASPGARSHLSQASKENFAPPTPGDGPVPAHSPKKLKTVPFQQDVAAGAFAVPMPISRMAGEKERDAESQHSMASLPTFASRQSTVTQAEVERVMGTLSQLTRQVKTLNASLDQYRTLTVEGFEALGLKPSSKTPEEQYQELLMTLLDRNDQLTETAHTLKQEKAKSALLEAQAALMEQRLAEISRRSEAESDTNSALQTQLAGLQTMVQEQRSRAEQEAQRAHQEQQAREQAQQEARQLKEQAESLKSVATNADSLPGQSEVPKTRPTVSMEEQLRSLIEDGIRQYRIAHAVDTMSTHQEFLRKTAQLRGYVRELQEKNGFLAGSDRLLIIGKIQGALDSVLGWSQEQIRTATEKAELERRKRISAAAQADA